MYCTVIVGAGCKQTHYCTTGINAILSNYFLESCGKSLSSLQISFILHVRNFFYKFSGLRWFWVSILSEKRL